MLAAAGLTPSLPIIAPGITARTTFVYGASGPISVSQTRTTNSQEFYGGSVAANLIPSPIITTLIGSASFVTPAPIFGASPAIGQNLFAVALTPSSPVPSIAPFGIFFPLNSAASLVDTAPVLAPPGINLVPRTSAAFGVGSVYIVAQITRT